MIRFLVVLTFCNIYLVVDSDNRVKEQVTFQLPKPFVVSTSLGISSSKDKPSYVVKPEKVMHNDTGSDQAPRKSYDRRKENDRFYNFQNDNMKKFVSSLPVNKQSPKINFYQMNCLVGVKCTAIIPGPKTRAPTPKNRTDEEMRIYLKKHGLENGFNYSDNDRVNKNSVVARYFRGDRERKVKARNARKGRRIPSIFDYDDYWPGSEYRPNKPTQNVPKNKSKAKIYKYGLKPSSNRNPNPNYWTRIHSPPSYGYKNKFNIADELYFSGELPSPTFSNLKPTIHTKKPYTYSQNSKGVWNRFSNSVISQYDKHSDDWVRISSSNTDLGSGYVNVNSKKPLNHKPNHQVGSNNQHTGVELTVLGATDEIVPYNNRKPIRPYKPEFTPTHSSHQSHFPQPPDRPFHSLHSPPSNSVSFPLNVLPSDLGEPVLVFSNEGLDTSVSNDSIASNSSFDSFYPTYNNVTYQIDANTTTLPPPLPTVTSRVLISNVAFNTPAATQSSQSLSSTTSGDGGGGGGFVSNAYAIMAAVGAGLIPASIAAILPVLLGRRRRRSLEGLRSSPLHLTPLAGRAPPDPILKFLLRNYSQNSQIFR